MIQILVFDLVFVQWIFWLLEGTRRRCVIIQKQILFSVDTTLYSGRTKVFIPPEYNVVSTDSNIYLNILLLISISGTRQGNM